MEKYAALMIDMEKSKSYPAEERSEIQRFLIEIADKLNKLFGESIECNVIFSAGDELQGLFKDVMSAIMYFRLFQMLAMPVKFRAGIGIGEWTVRIPGRISTQQDGTAYHNARKAINSVHKKQLSNVIVFSGEDDDMGNYLLNASHELKEQQVYKQNLVGTAIELFYPMIIGNAENYELDVFAELIQAKFCYEYGRKENEKIIPMIPNDNKINNFITIDGRINDIEDVIIIKNTSSVIASLLGCSRQNVDTIIKRGFIYKIRQMDYMALTYFYNKYVKNE